MQSSKTRLRELGECWFACVAVLLCLRAAVDSRRGVDSLGRGPGLGMLGVHEADYIDGKVGGRQGLKRVCDGVEHLSHRPRLLGHGGRRLLLSSRPSSAATNPRPTTWSATTSPIDLCKATLGKCSGLCHNNGAAHRKAAVNLAEPPCDG